MLKKLLLCHATYFSSSLNVALPTEKEIYDFEVKTDWVRLVENEWDKVSTEVYLDK